MGGIKYSSNNGGGVVGAANGVSLNTTTKRVELGQAIAAPGNPAALLNNREIPVGINFLRFLFSPASFSFINFGLDSVFGSQLGLEVAGDSNNGDAPNFSISDPLGSPTQQQFTFRLDSEVFTITSALGNVLTIAPAQFTMARSLKNTNTISGGRPVVDNAANFNAGGLVDGRTVYTNRGAPGAITASIFTSVGLSAASYLFYNVTGNAFNIQAGAGTTIRNGALLKAAPGIITSNAIGSCIELVAIGNNEWVATQVVGAWV